MDESPDSQEHSSALRSSLYAAIDRLMDAPGGASPDLWAEIVAQHGEEAKQLERLIPVLGALGRLPGPGAPHAATAAPCVIGDYEVIRLIGRGGMGLVYEARQRTLDRRVALKILPAAVSCDEIRLLRFQNEAMVTAKLRHPHIIPVHTVSCDQDTHYYVMEYIEGANLAELLRWRGAGACDFPESAEADSEEHRLGVSKSMQLQAQTIVGLSRPQWYRFVATVGRQVAEALEHAHDNDVVHRDVKPSNILVNRSLNALVSDFGLARLASAPGITLTGDVIGTLRYMSPEQARGDQRVLDHRTDIYSLGVTLYELATLRPAFPQEERQQLFEGVLEREPPHPRRLVADMPRDLETILLKAIRKSPAERYASCRELADDLESFLEHRPVSARRTTLVQRLAKWGYRNARILGVVAAAAVLVACVLGWAGYERQQKMYERHLRSRELQEFERDRQTAVAHRYVVDINRAWHAWLQGDIGEARSVLDRWRPGQKTGDLRDFSWHFLRSQTEHLPSPIGQHEGEAYFIQFSPDGRVFATAGSDGIRIWDSHSANPVRHLTHHAVDVNWISFSSDGSSLATAGDDGTVWVLETAGWNPRIHRKFESPIVAAEFSPDGRWLAVAEREQGGRGTDEITLLDPASLEPMRTLDLAGLAFSLQGIAFSPDGTRLATVGSNGGLVVWEGSELESRQALNASGSLNALNAVAFAPREPRILAACKDGSLHVYQSSPLRAVAHQVVHNNSIESLQHAVHDGLFVTASRDGTAKVWVPAPQPARQPTLVRSVRHGAPLWCARLSPDGDYLVAVDREGHVFRHLVRSLQARSMPSTLRIEVDSPSDPQLAFTEGGRRLAIASSDVALYDAASGELLWRRRPREGAVHWLGDDPRQGTLILVTDQGTLEAWDARDGRELYVWRDERFTGTKLGPPRISSGGEIVVLLEGGGAAVSLDAVSIDAGRDAAPPTARVVPLPFVTRRIDAWDPKGQRLLLTSEAQANYIWEPSTDGLVKLSDQMEDISWTPDGQLLIGLAYDGSARLWNGGGDYRELATWTTEASGGAALALSSDGRTLATAGIFGSMNLWNVRNGRKLLSLDLPLKFWSRHIQLAFSPDSCVLAASTRVGRRAEVHLWRADRGND